MSPSQIRFECMHWTVQRFMCVCTRLSSVCLFFGQLPVSIMNKVITIMLLTRILITHQQRLDRPGCTRPRYTMEGGPNGKADQQVSKADLTPVLHLKKPTNASWEGPLGRRTAEVS